MWTIEQAVKHYETLASRLEDICLEPASEYPKQTAAWLKILKAAAFEYDEAWRIINSPTPDVTDNDRKRAVVILATFRDSLGRLSE